MQEYNALCDKCFVEMEDVIFYSNLFDNPTLEECGQFTKELAPEVLCSNCADEIFPILEKCDFNCLNCKAQNDWKLNSKSCINLQNQLMLIDDEQLRILEFIKFWELVRKNVSITAVIQSIKYDISEQKYLQR